jgi:hypothetical protein
MIMVDFEGIIFLGIPCLLVGTGIFFIIKSGKKQNLFIGGMATDSGDQSLFF